MDDTRSMMNESRVLLITGLAPMMILLAGCTKQASELVPVTTSSSEALEAYLTGRDLQERLRTLDAKPYLEEAIKLHPNFVTAHLMYGMATGTTKGFEIQA